MPSLKSSLTILSFLFFAIVFSYGCSEKKSFSSNDSSSAADSEGDQEGKGGPENGAGPDTDGTAGTGPGGPFGPGGAGAPGAPGSNGNDEGGGSGGSSGGGDEGSGSGASSGDGSSSGGGQGGSCAPGELEVKFDDNIQACFDSNGIWDFSRNICLENVRSSFNCDFDSLTKAINDAGMATPSKITQAIGKAKLIACGEKNDGNTIIAQWVYPPSGSKCEHTKQDGLPVTGCYRKRLDGEASLDRSDPEAVKAFVNACLGE